VDCVVARSVKALAGLGLLIVLFGCSSPPEEEGEVTTTAEWTTTDVASVELACMRSAAEAMGRPVNELRADLLPICEGLAGQLEAAGCSPREARDIALALALVGEDAAREIQDDC